MPRFRSATCFALGWALTGSLSAILSAAALGGMAALRGLPVWMPLNATTHALYGASAASIESFDLAHTGLGAAIHVVSCFFWAGVALLLFRNAPAGNGWFAWMIGLGTALLAGLVDYGLMPARLRPGWELILSPVGVAAGLAAMGVGLSLGLGLTHAANVPAGSADPSMPAGRRSGPKDE